MLRLCVLLVAAVGTCLAIQRVKIKPQMAYHNQNCSLDQIKDRNPTNCSGLEHDTVAHGGNCTVDNVPTRGEEKAMAHRRLELDVLNCDHGRWTGTDTSVGLIKHRQKRWVWLAITAVAVAVAWHYFGGGQTIIETTITKTPPSFAAPCKPAGLRENYNVAAGESSLVVSWIAPTATDKDDDGAPSITQVSGGANGGHFDGDVSGKTHYITYEAVDSDGLTGHCYFLFIVTILTCDSIGWPDNGARTCLNSSSLGSSCHYTCDSGYRISGSSTVTCESVNDASPSWSTIPTCQKLTCIAPTSPADGSLDCSDLTFSYQTLCTTTCDDGYDLKGSLYMQCLASGTWSNAGLSACKDDTPPTISCQTPQVFYADRSKNSTSVSWTLPTSADSIDSNPEIVKTEGPTQGDVIEVGSEIVKYKAIDSAGNESPECFIELRVKDIECGHPLDTFNDSYIRPNCTMSGYVYGTECTLTCTSNLPLEGTDLIVCEKKENQYEGVWDWGNGTKPYCREIACPELNSPINGALVSDTITTRPVRTMMCNEKYDIAPMGSSFNGMFFCTDDGYWKPFNYVPNCVEPMNPRILSLPAEVFYYGGNCGTEATMAQIEQNFKVIIEEGLNPYYESICNPGETCTAGNVVIVCGPIQSARKRRSPNLANSSGNIIRHVYNAEGNGRDHHIHKRQEDESHVLILQFNIIVVLNLANTTLRDALLKYDGMQLDILKPAVQVLIDNGAFDIPEFQLKSDSFQTKEYGDVICPPGYTLVQGSCKPCPVGHFLNDSVCDQCAIGQYKSTVSEVACTTCPTGFSTRNSGSNSTDDCIALCGLGTYSPDTMENCSVCMHGTYQDEQGQTACKQCSVSTTTVSTKRTSVSDCTSYDVLLGTTNGNVTVASISESLNDISLMLWSKRVDGQSSNTVVRLTNDDSHLIAIHLTENVRVEIPSLVDEIVGTHSSVAWTHVAVAWDTVNAIVNVYLNGENIHTSTAVAPTSPLLQNAQLVVASSGQSGVYLTGLHLLANVLTDTDIETHATSCQMTEDNDVINMEVFKDIAELEIVVPSKCDAVDECYVSSPCNGHPCIDGQGTFTCTCTGGWSGSTCTTPPDFCIDNECRNDATCQSGLSNYTCTCSPGYDGILCEIPPVDGGLSDWSSWTTCSKSCGTGTQSRTRQCDSPVPDEYGNDCVGDLTDTISCNTEECRVCDELQRQYGTLKNCSMDEVTGSMACTIYCVEQMEMPPGLREFQVYKCGPDTDYKWDSMGITPSCVSPVGPRRIEITADVDITPSVDSSAEDSLIAAVNSNIQSTDCFITEACQTSIDINASKRRRRSAGTTLTTTFQIPLVLGPDLQYDVYVSNGTVSGALLELVVGITYLESTAQYLQNYMSDVFDVVIDGVTYAADVSSLTFVAGVTCDSGHAVSGGVCLECPSGTYLVDGVCSFCEKGTYQPSTGQTSCITCSSGVTTSAIGSSAISQCAESVEVSNTSTTTPGTANTTTTMSGTGYPGTTEAVNTDNEDSTDGDDDIANNNNEGPGISSEATISDKKIWYTAIFIFIVALVLAVVAIFIAVWFKKIRPQSKFTGSVTNMLSATDISRTKVYRRATQPSSPHQTTGSDILPEAKGSMCDETSDVASRRYITMLSRDSTTLSASGVDLRITSSPPYDEVAGLPGNTEKMEFSPPPTVDRIQNKFSGPLVTLQSPLFLKTKQPAA